MIIVHINPVGVEKVSFQSDSDLAEDLCLAVWPLVRKGLDNLHSKLRKAANRTLKIVEREKELQKDGWWQKETEEKGARPDD